MMAEFPSQLRAARQAADMTQAEAATAAEISQPLWQLYETGKKEPGITRAAVLVAAVGRVLTLAPSKGAKKK